MQRRQRRVQHLARLQSRQSQRVDAHPLWDDANSPNTTSRQATCHAHAVFGRILGSSLYWWARRQRGKLMNMREYLKNRVAFPLAELAKHRGEWVAWSPD